MNSVNHKQCVDFLGEVLGGAALSIYKSEGVNYATFVVPFRNAVEYEGGSGTITLTAGRYSSELHFGEGVTTPYVVTRNRGLSCSWEAGYAEISSCVELTRLRTASKALMAHLVVTHQV